jgi:hypothetical protein
MSSILDKLDAGSRLLEHFSTCRKTGNRSYALTKQLASTIESHLLGIRDMLSELNAENTTRREALSVALTDAVGSRGPESVSTLIGDPKT